MVKIKGLMSASELSKRREVLSLKLTCILCGHADAASLAHSHTRQGTIKALHDLSRVRVSISRGCERLRGKREHKAHLDDLSDTQNKLN